MTPDVLQNRLKAMLAAVLAAMAIIMAGLLLGGPKAALPDIAVPVVSRIGPAPENNQAARDHAGLIEHGRYHAAFAVGDGAAYGWSDNYATADMADAAALAWCRDAGENCRIVTRIAPATDMTHEGQALSWTTALALRDFGHKPAPKALALSTTGAWGMSWNQPGGDMAAQVALRNCQSRIDLTNKPGGLPAGSCRVLWVR